MGVYEVIVSSRFSARHGVALPGGVMEEPHEHVWVITASFRADELDENGFVIDFTKVQKALNEIVAELEGNDLNKLLANRNGSATAECLAEYLADKLSQRVGKSVYYVRVSEAPGCSAAFYPTGEGT